MNYHKKNNNYTRDLEKVSVCKSDINCLNEEIKERTENKESEILQNKDSNIEINITNENKEEILVTEGVRDLDICNTGALELEETTERKDDSLSNQCAQTSGDATDSKTENEKDDDDLINTNETELLADSINCHDDSTGNTKSSIDTTQSCTLTETEDSVT